MIKHPIRKFLGLTVLYTIIILGIFLLQFRSEISISQTFGVLRLQLAETTNAEQETVLKNQFQISFKGLILSANEKHPITILYSNGEEQPLILENWSKNDDFSGTLTFNNDVSIIFSVTDETAEASLSVQAKLPNNVKEISIPYKPSGGYLVTEQTENRTILSSKTLQYKIEASKFYDEKFVLSKNDAIAYYGLFDPTSIFDYASVRGIANASKESFDSVIRQFKTDFIQLFSHSISDSLMEQTIVAYVAAMAETGNLKEALALIPDAAKNNSRRTYLSAPYFNSLVAMNPSLVMYIENSKNMISYAVEQKSLDIFVLNNLAELLCIQKTKDLPNQLVALPLSLTDFNPTAKQAAGILNTFVKLSSLDSSLAEPLAAVVDVCLMSIAEICSLEGNSILLEEDDVSVELSDAISLGMALISYGRYSQNIDVENTGYLIISNKLTDTTGINLRSFGELYPILVPDNNFYPHIQIIADSNKSESGLPVWAWTVARNLKYNVDSDKNVTFSIDFPEEWTQYIIINGVNSFKRIDIYDMAFRTDPRFETYNSSGYVYNKESKTLFLKSRHKSVIEDVKLYYNNAE